MTNVRDWTRYIVPRINENTLANGRPGGADFCTTDLISLPTYDEIRVQTNTARSVTDFALMNNAEQINTEDRPDDLTPQGKVVGHFLSRSAGTTDVVLSLQRDNSIGWLPVDLPVAGLCPHLTLRLPDGVSTIQEITREVGPVREVKLKDGENYYTIDLGELPKTRVSDDAAAKLEKMYNGGHLQGGLACTGRLFTTNGQRDFRNDFLSKQNPEFSYQGKKYVRVVVQNQPSLTADNHYQDGTKVPEEGIQWAEVEPITFRIQNTRALLSGEARGLDLASEELIMGGLPFYPNPDYTYPTMWQNSLLRAFLNSADSRELDGNPAYKSTLQWDFRKSGFLYQALNMTREPTRIYTVPASENRIADYALAGCVGIKKIIIPSHVTEIDQHAFDGCVNAQLCVKANRNLLCDQDALAGTDFQFVYLAKDGREVILSPYEDVTLNAAYLKSKFHAGVMLTDLGKDNSKLGTLNMNAAATGLKGGQSRENSVQENNREL